jgi:hypothetical protein
LDEIVKKVKENANKTTLVEEKRTADQINETRRVLPRVEAPTPAQFDTVLSSTEVPITAPGQIAIHIIASETTSDWVEP